MKLTTSKGNEYTVEFIDGPTITSGHVVLQMQDERSLPEIAAEFESLEWLRRESENQGDKEFIGYTKLDGVTRVADGVVLIALGK